MIGEAEHSNYVVTLPLHVYTHSPHPHILTYTHAHACMHELHRRRRRRMSPPQKPKTLAMAVAVAFALGLLMLVAGEGEEEEKSNEYCRRVIWGWKLRDCEKFLRKRCRWRRGESCRDHLEECCWELDELGTDCVCDGVRHVVSRRLRDLQGKTRKEMVQKARNLPAFCSMGIGRCYVPKYLSYSQPL